MGLADELLEDAQHLAERGIAENRPSSMRRAVSTAYYAVFHLFVEEFVDHWPFPRHRARLGRMFEHRKMLNAPLQPGDSANPTATDGALFEIKIAFGRLQADRHRADYDLSWNIVPTDVTSAITLAQNTFANWRSIRDQDAAQNYLLSMFGANR